MAFLVSPGVQVREIDLTNVIPAVSTSIGAIAGPFEKGPVSSVTTISSEEQLVSIFGKPNSSNFEFFFTAANFLQYSDALRIVLKSSFDPKIEWVFPEGTVPYTPNDVPAGTEHTMLASEAKKLWHYIKGADNATKQHQKEHMFFQLLEGLHSSEAELICRAKDKKLHQIYKGLSSNVVREAFGWNDEFKTV